MLDISAPAVCFNSPSGSYYMYTWQISATSMYEAASRQASSRTHRRLNIEMSGKQPLHINPADRGNALRASEGCCLDLSGVPSEVSRGYISSPLVRNNKDQSEIETTNSTGTLRL